MAIVNNTSTSPAEQASEIGVEIWRDVRGYEGLYSVSNLGRVKSLVDNFGNQREKILKPELSARGYLIVVLCKNQGKKSSRVHRVVLRAFKRARYVGQNECRHLNGNPGDNRLCNLEFGTKKENAADKIVHGTVNHGERNGQAKLTEEQIREIRRLYATGEYSQHKTGKMFNVSRSAINRIVSWESWAHVS